MKKKKSAKTTKGRQKLPGTGELKPPPLPHFLKNLGTAPRNYYRSTPIDLSTNGYIKSSLYYEVALQRTMTPPFWLRLLQFFFKI